MYNGLLNGLLILFSGGVDSSLLAALAHACLPLEQPIELVGQLHRTRAFMQAAHHWLQATPG
ncbi:hypothetical protein HaLaN_11668 [Haematococcus lacustris]|uniref:Uncharacterized protein n=1 Tax=Haematococcus lacustris TaxID=44745 RepID=A0A699Z867_HAELA|nr:hypothetical protein HaLaN_11668 [Haematococcus lacustris]